MTVHASRKRRPLLPWVLGCVLLGLLLLIGGVVAINLSAGDDAPPVTTPVAASTPTAAAGKRPADTIEDGVWTVGEDIPAGTYKVAARLADGQGCYWKITKTGDPSDIIDNALPKGGLPRVTLAAGQTFETKRCGTWRKQ